MDAPSTTVAERRYRAFVEVLLGSGRRVVSGNWNLAPTQTTASGAVDDAFDGLEAALDAATDTAARRKTTTRLAAPRAMR
ncbi:MAG TPA: hypothetical protein VHB21_10780 [Minicystis sp.]|nr:hypothetical protein [Minicystis sp.]